MSDRHTELTQRYSTWGDKLLQHADRLSLIQVEREFRPITVQLDPTEVCESSCDFCSVDGRPRGVFLPFVDVQRVLRDFHTLGAKAVELTGGGNPMLYRDRDGRDIRHVVACAAGWNYKIGLITNSHTLGKLDERAADRLAWVRVSLAKLDEGMAPEQYDFRPVPTHKIGLSYIIHEKTTPATIHAIAKLAVLHPGLKFVRIAGDCLRKGSNAAVAEHWRPIIDAVDRDGKFFVKDIGDNEVPFNDGCYVGMLRPYVAPAPDGSGYHVYTCTSHVLQQRTYDLDYSLCKVEDVLTAWPAMNERFKRTGTPYEVRGNGGSGWAWTCDKCYYANNNRLLHTVARQDIFDKDFA